jgi:hypothetical protein
MHPRIAGLVPTKAQEHRPRTGQLEGTAAHKRSAHLHLLTITTPTTISYGGLWKNHHAGKSGKHRVPKSASSPGHGSRPQQQDKLQEQEQLRELQEGGNEQESEGHVERDEEQVGGLEEMLLAAAAACPDADNSSTTPT